MLPRALDLWLPAWLSRDRATRRVEHVLIAVCDHFEPLHEADRATALRRVEAWRRDYPASVRGCEDADGVAPRHTFFYPVEQYDAELVGRIAELCSATGCEVEIHLHHRDDTADGVRAKLERGRDDLAAHGLLSRDPDGRIRYGFIHGNWALDHSHPDGRACGVTDELRILAETGCYADFTMPSAPDRCQTRTINSIYHATDTPARKSHDTGIAARVGARPAADLLMVQGPLGFDARRKKWGVVPRIENGDITGRHPPTAGRFRLWTEIAPVVKGREEWVFVKLHTHGGIEPNFGMILGEPMRRFREDILGRSPAVHWVSAREMVNIIRAAEDGHSGDPGRFRDHFLRR